MKEVRVGRNTLRIAGIILNAVGLVFSQAPEMQQKIAELKQAVASNKQALAQYTWVEQVTISLKGEQKKQQNFQVRIGPDGKPQKQSLDQAQPQQSANGDARRRRGRVKEHVVEKKKEEYKDYADSIKSLIEQYVPPEKEMIEQAKAKGNIEVSPAPGSDGNYQLVFTNYVKPGDKMAIVFDKARNAIVSVAINSYLDDPKDVITAEIQFSSLPGGPNHVASVAINGVSKQLAIAIQNGNYQRL
ncbi:MAG: hypothetical protein ACLGRW_00315 [Acidobacteriota bacterium]|jgi:hypothetical protein